jgi:hypothetical protein
MNDLEQSMRLASKLHSEQGRSEFNMLLVSKSFWPIDYDADTFSTDKLFVGEHFSAFKQLFEKQQPIKTTLFHNNLGKVELDLEIRDKTVAVVCQPIHAAIISFFSEDVGYNANKGVSLAFLVSQLGCSEEYLRAKINFWTNKNILIEKEIVPSGGIEIENPEFQIEETFYFLCESLDDQEALISANLEDDNKQFIKSGQMKGDASDVQKEMVQKVILQIIASSGPQNLDKLIEIIQIVYKVGLTRTKSTPLLLVPNLLRIV